MTTFKTSVLNYKILKLVLENHNSQFSIKIDQIFSVSIHRMSFIFYSFPWVCVNCLDRCVWWLTVIKTMINTQWIISDYQYLIWQYIQQSNINNEQQQTALLQHVNTMSNLEKRIQYLSGFLAKCILFHYPYSIESPMSCYDGFR